MLGAIGVGRQGSGDMRGFLTNHARVLAGDRSLHPEDRRMAVGGAMFAIASLYAQDQQPHAEKWLSDLERMDLRFFAAAGKAALA